MTTRRKRSGKEQVDGEFRCPVLCFRLCIVVFPLFSTLGLWLGFAAGPIIVYWGGGGYSFFWCGLN